MRSSIRVWVVALCVLLLAGCGGMVVKTKDGRVYSPFEPAVDEFKELVLADKIHEAAELFENPELAEYWQKYMAKMPEADVPAFQLLSAKFGMEYEPELARARARLSRTEWPGTPRRWPQVRATLAQADEAVAKAQGYAVLRLPEYTPPGVVQLKAMRDDLAGRIEADKAKLFAGYDFVNAPNFFETYPVGVRPAEVLPDVDTFAESFLKGRSRSGITTILTTYGGLLPPAYKESAARMYFASFDEVGDDASLAEILNGLIAAKALGLPMDKAPTEQIVLVDITSPTLIDHHELDFPVAFDPDLPFAVESKSLHEAFAMMQEATEGIFVLVDVAAATARRKIGEHRYMTSAFVERTERVPNPKYEELKNRIQMTMTGAMMDNQAYQQQQFQMQMQAQQQQMAIMQANQQALQNYAVNGGPWLNTYSAQSNPFAGLAGAFAGLAHAMEMEERNKKVAEMQKELGATPTFVEQPVMREYTIPVRPIKVVKSATVNFYIVDKKRGTQFRDVLDAREYEDFLVVYDVHPQDPEHEELVVQNDTDKGVTAFEEGAVAVSLSDIFNYYIDNADKTEPLTKLAALHEDILARRTEVLESFKNRQYLAEVEKDPRFQSVVVIYNPAGSLGSGFFVTDNIVCTNWHVIEGAKFMEMKLFNGHETFGKVIAHDERLDLALIKVQERGRPVRFYDKLKLRLGGSVDVIGAPQGLDFTITRGIVSALREKGSVNRTRGKKVLAVQIDAPVNPGNSGGPVFLSDTVIGVVSSGLAGNEGLNFSIHYSEVLNFLEENGVKPLLEES